MDRLKQLFEELISGYDIENEPALIKMIFAGRRKKSFPCRKVTMRPVVIGGKLMYQAEYLYEKKALHKNFTPDEAVKESISLISEDFKQLNAFTACEEIQVLASKPAVPRITRNSRGSLCRKPESLSHDRKKKRLIPEGIPCDFLIRLGIMDKDGKVYKNHYAKYRQINRYLEIVDDALLYLPETERPLRIIDFGCGKSYLTFALYYYLKVLNKRNVEIVGLDLKEDVIDLCSSIAEDLGYSELKFLMGDIADYTNDHADMVVTLHACDTATDYALINAVSWNAPVILSVPCCQHELFSQIDEPVIDPVLRHGILRDRFTEILTDGLRALKLQAAGYEVSCIEFTSLEHTARNIMIRAVKGPDAHPDPSAQKEYEALCDLYNVSPTIGRMVF